MGSTSWKVVAVIGSVVLAMALFVFLRDTDDDLTVADDTETIEQTTQTDSQKPAPPPEPQNLIEVVNGESAGGPAEYTFKSGDEIAFTVRSDVADEIHVHGYDVSKPIKAGGEVSFAIPADIEGIFEVELEETAVPIAEVRVEP